MKLGSNLRTGKNWNLTSWLSDEIPDSAEVSRGQPYWTSGNLNNQTCPYMFGLNSPFSRYQYNLSFVYNNEERYFSFHGINGVKPMWILTPRGQVQDADHSQNWTPEFCYGYDSDNGCVADSNTIRCRSENDKFSGLNGNFSPGMTSSSYDDNSTLSISDCMVRRWNDCGCLGFTTSCTGVGCITWTGTRSVNNFSINPQGNYVLKYVLISSNPSKGK
ncbi:hypothetical protein L1887_25442 [Cichorium endivia]|nr:hypothetical protein L1887_25442 [Cichorium endivia]